MSNTREQWTEAIKKRELKRSKYGAKKTVVDGITFDSKREAQRYHELKLRERAGEIRHLKCQVAYPLHVVGGEVKDVVRVIGDYVADFTYEERSRNTSHAPDYWPLVVEDAKGVRTPLYRWKKKHVEAQYGIQIREI